MGDRFTQSLVNKTNLRPWDQVMILSQATLNAGLKNTWLSASSPDKAASPIRRVDYVSRTSGTIKANLGPPNIIIDIVNSGYWYEVPFVNGTMSLRDGHGASSNAQFDLTGWMLRYRVPYFVRDTLRPGSEEFNQFFQKTGLRIANNAGFSLTRLSIGLDIPTLSESHFGRYGDYKSWQRRQDPKILENFQALLIELTGKRQLGQGTVVGVFLTTSTPAVVNPLAPALPPTSVYSGIYPWLDPNASQPVAANNQPQNGFCYLIMNNNDDAPSPPKLDQSGTFVNGIGNDAARLCINGEQFWSNWLLPLMQRFNQAVEITCPKANLNCRRDSVSIQSVYALGSNRLHTNPNDPYFRFTPNSNSPERPQVPATWTSSGDGHRSSANDQCIIDRSVNQFMVIENSRNSSTISCTAGTPKFQISGSSFFHMHVDHTSSGGDNSESDCNVTVNWSVHYTLGHVAGAGETLAVIPDRSINPHIQLSVRPTRNDGSGWTSNWTESAHALGHQIYESVKTIVDQNTTILATALNQMHRFFLPGAGVFAIKDAFFNVRGDLLISLAYDGIDDEE